MFESRIRPADRRFVVVVVAFVVGGNEYLVGQCGSTRRKGFPAPVILWDYKTGSILFELQGLTEVKRIVGALSRRSWFCVHGAGGHAFR